MPILANERLIGCGASGRRLLSNEAAKTKRSARVLYGIFLLSLILDIGGALGIKYGVTLVILIYIAINSLQVRIPYTFLIIEGPLFVLFPIFLLLLSVCFYSVELTTAISGLSFLAVWLILPLLLFIRKQNIVSLFNTMMFLGALITLVTFLSIFLFYILGRSDLINAANSFGATYRLGYFGQRPETGIDFVPNVYFRWTMLLIPAAILLIGESRKKLIVVLLAILSTLSTAAIFSVSLGLILIALISSTQPFLKAARGAFLGLLTIVFIGLVAWFFEYRQVINLMFDKVSFESAPAAIRISDIHSIYESMKESAFVTLFGMGVGSSFYRIGSGEYAINVEVSHFNLVRQFGLVYAVLFFWYVFSAFWWLVKTDDIGRRIAVGMLALFLAAGTNPLLMSPVFFLILVIGRSYAIQYARDHTNVAKAQRSKGNYDCLHTSVHL